MAELRYEGGLVFMVRLLLIPVLIPMAAVGYLARMVVTGFMVGWRWHINK